MMTLNYKGGKGTGGVKNLEKSDYVICEPSSMQFSQFVAARQAGFIVPYV